MVNTSTYLIKRLAAIAMTAMITAAIQLPAFAGKVSVASGVYRTPVVELYTSEGCSSCPQADQWVSKLGDALSGEFHAVPLAFHVDYWNYLGWEDPFSRPEFTERQRDLAAINKQRGIYTPQFAVSGRETRGTSAVVQAIQSANAEIAAVTIKMDLNASENGQVSAAFNIENTADGAELYIAVYENDISRPIGSGENSGKTLHHDFVVRHWVRAAALPTGLYQGDHALKLEQDWQLQNLGLAAVVIDRPSGKTLQAVSISLAELFPGIEES
jgi:hypothetical protein